MKNEIINLNDSFCRNMLCPDTVSDKSEQVILPYHVQSQAPYRASRTNISQDRFGYNSKIFLFPIQPYRRPETQQIKCYQTIGQIDEWRSWDQRVFKKK